MSEPEVKYGIFKTEIKNRFLCTVNVDGIDTLCYIPSSCRLSNFINMKGRMVLLLPIKKENARTKYSVYAIQYRRGFVPVSLSSVNQVIKNELNRRIFSFLGSRKQVFGEKSIDGYKSDLYIEDSDTVVEIKSILSFGKEALFPTVSSERANHQLENIRELLLNGHKVCYMFISMYGGTKQITVNEEQTEYFSLFRKCIEVGMTVRGFSLYMDNGVPKVKATVKCIF
ncbi:DNA-binding sugar fermentation-stimulating protein [Muricomes intestini]|jgi:DNA-binding sugar fermentation-stimulating protein|uniref:DNA-binding sugar fermentation-stimulating protein n=1 Tax=Muricomes intestini TaxID=1796634 RepID=A0A4R3KBB5_9FIRM|nr:DNA/RNA nuclease SfsA [Muricomes intestini]TCS80305.1 DNA-binding sugar fermentation-stimulating protein [Muricomes intestini]